MFPTLTRPLEIGETANLEDGDCKRKTEIWSILMRDVQVFKSNGTQQVNSPATNSSSVRFPIFNSDFIVGAKTNFTTRTLWLTTFVIIDDKQKSSAHFVVQKQTRPIPMANGSKNVIELFSKKGENTAVLQSCYVLWACVRCRCIDRII